MTSQRVNSSLIRAAQTLTLIVRAASGHYHTVGDITSADCVVALSFGYRLVRTGAREPGPCNEYLASLALATSRDQPIIAQIEIDQAIRSLRRGMGADHVIGSARNPALYLDTFEFAVQVHAIMDDQGWRTTALIAHPHHLPRTQAVFASLGIETATPGGVRPIWDRESNQPWTRGPVSWAIHEMAALWWYKRRGKLSCSTIRDSRMRPAWTPEHR
jgi:uncharacterized SAM-binding protein YcdF (DUF218 family)